MYFQARARLLHHYFLASYFVLLLLCQRYLEGVSPVDGWTVLFSNLVYFSYGLIYLLPAVGITTLVHRLLAWRHGRRDWPRWASGTVYGVAVAATGATAALLFADRIVYDLFSFHLNGFVWNLITTPGGVESMGGNDAASLTYGAIGFGLFALQAGLLYALYRYLAYRRVHSAGRPRPIYRYLLTLFVIMALGERATYGVSHLNNRVPVLAAASAFPFYQPLTFRSLAKRFGYEAVRTPQVRADVEGGQLTYPLAPLDVERPERPLNIVWLVAESWRSSMLDPEIMPETWSFAERAHRFTHHYSGGNGTRMGLFTMFYGLYGSYWFRFLDERRSPVVMDLLQAQDYQLSLYTSAKFSYPEFDKTLFAKVADKHLHEYHEGQGWERDRKNVTGMLSFLKERDRSRPFMTFLFFESPHARYYFPPESVIREPYLADFNYATMSLEEDIEQIYARYVNSCRHLDSQFGRVLGYLEAEGLLDDTIVVITGDHGEEFLEHGHWGHNSEFTEEQVRVPLVLWVPGTGPSRIDRMTSHLDIVPTLLPLLGVRNPASDYAQGISLFSEQERSHILVSDWSRIGIIDGAYKAVFPLKHAGLEQSRVTTRDDQPLADPSRFYQSHQGVLVEVMRALTRFSGRNG